MSKPCYQEASVCDTALREGIVFDSSVRERGNSVVSGQTQ
jgi:hypothetical protein